MNILIGTVLIWVAAILITRKLYSRRPEQIPLLYSRARALLLFILPRIVIGLIAASFLALLLPVETVQRTFGANAGLTGVMLAICFGAIMPGGPLAAFAIGAAALKAGAGLGAFLAFVSGWSVLSLMRTISYESGFMGNRFVLRRIVCSLPFVILLGIAGLLLENNLGG